MATSEYSTVLVEFMIKFKKNRILLVGISAITFLVGCLTSNPTLENKPKIVSGAELERIQPLFSSDNLLRNYKLKVLETEEFSDENLPDSCKVDSVDNVVEVKAWKGKDTITTTIEISGQRMTMLDDVQVHLTDNHLIISWVSIPFARFNFGDEHPLTKTSWMVKVLDLKSKVVINETEVFNYKCFQDLKTVYNSNTNSLLYVFRDNCQPTGKDIKLGILPLDSIQPIKPRKTLIRSSELKKVNFVQNKDQVYLTSVYLKDLLTGSGQKKFGIYPIEEHNKIGVPYFIEDSCFFDEKSIIVNDTLYYRLLNSTTYSEMLVKKIALEDLLK